MNLTGRAGLSYGNTFSGSIYNGNRDVTITEVEIAVTASKGDSKVYITKVLVLPLSTSNFSFDIVVGDKGSEYSWNIVSAKGY